MEPRRQTSDEDKNKKSLQTLLDNQSQCPICLEPYDLIRKIPNMICLNQHSSCENCLKSVYRRRKCPVCSDKLITRGQVKRNRLMCSLIEEMVKFGGERIIQCAKYKYRGTIKKGKPDGKGEKILKEGHYLRGEFKDGEIIGKCEAITKQGAKFNGTAENGILTGSFMTKYGSIIEGTFDIQDILKSSNCTKKYPNGDNFVGNVKDLKAEGFGKLTFRNGNTFEGIFLKDYIDPSCRGIISGIFPVDIHNGQINIQGISEHIRDLNIQRSPNRERDLNESSDFDESFSSRDSGLNDHQ